MNFIVSRRKHCSLHPLAMWNDFKIRFNQIFITPYFSSMDIATVVHFLSFVSGGRKRSSFHYDLWNIKYLSKFKWDDLTEEIAYKNAAREQKLAMELSAAKRERDFYLSKVDQSNALSKIEERLKKKKKIEMVPKVVRQFPQKKPVVNETGEQNAEMSKDFLAGIFGGS
ncbi:hypothetical protein ACJIZ3_015106 [Penstemon smallii]|uniref:Uncharacterized protein n=1 Tax=Penstemon smallii TaxID=265156 RepID=A0ABD3RLS7_9LAMI